MIALDPALAVMLTPETRVLSVLVVTRTLDVKLGLTCTVAGSPSSSG